MADRYFGFTCDPVRGERDLVLVRVASDELLYLDDWGEQAFRAYRKGRSSMQGYRDLAKRAMWTSGLVVRRVNAAQVCLDLVRRGVKPWADPRCRRAA